MVVEFEEFHWGKSSGLTGPWVMLTAPNAPLKEMSGMSREVRILAMVSTSLLTVEKSV